MKKLIILLLSLNLFADMAELEKLYEEANYEKAIQQARELKSEYGNPMLHMLWAKSAESLGRLDEAMSAYERVVILDENNLEAKLSLAEIYNKTSRKQLALESKKDLQKYKLTPKQREMLELIKDQEVQSIKAHAKLAFGYDNNLNVSSLDKKTSSFSRINGSVSYLNDFKDKKEWYFKGDFNFYYQKNFDEDLYDLLLSSVGAGVGYSKDFYNIYLPVSYGVLNYLDEDLLSQIKVTPKVDFRINNSMISLGAKYSQKSYKPTQYKVMDDNSFGVDAGFYHFERSNYFYTKLMYENISSKNSGGIYIDRDVLGFSGGMQYGFLEDFASRIDYKLRKRSYDDLSLTKNEKREDLYNQVEIKVSYYFKEVVELYLSDVFTDNNSNNDSTDYTKNIVMFGMGINY